MLGVIFILLFRKAINNNVPLSLYQVSGAMKRVFKLVSACKQHALISSQLHLLTSAPSVGGVSHTEAGQVIQNRPSLGVITHLTVLEQDTRAVDAHEADHTHISNVLHSCAAQSAVSH